MTGIDLAYPAGRDDLSEVTGLDCPCLSDWVETTVIPTKTSNAQYLLIAILQVIVDVLQKRFGRIMILGRLALLHCTVHAPIGFEALVDYFIRVLPPVLEQRCGERPGDLLLLLLYFYLIYLSDIIPLEARTQGPWIWV